MAHKMEIIEKLGSGLRMIFDSCKKAKLMPPQFKEDGDYVKVVFCFLPEKDSAISDEDLIIAMLHKKRTTTVKDIMCYTNRSKSTNFRSLNALVNKGTIKRIGKGRATQYTLVQKKHNE